jgi:hypothetical protein
VKKPTEYEIRTLADFLLVPEEKRATMLQDFEIWLAYCGRATNMENAMKGIPGVKISLNTGLFHWIDDSKSGLTQICFRVHTEPEEESEKR